LWVKVATQIGVGNNTVANALKYKDFCARR
jgi:hypothetical protein